MGKFVSLALILFIVGCVPAMPEYIGRADHPYDRRINADFDKVTGAITYVLKKKGWVINTEALPSIYERDERYDNNGYQNLLIMTKPRGHEHLNIFVHGINQRCEVEIRYESRTSLIKQFSSERNDAVVNGILNAIEQEVNR